MSTSKKVVGGRAKPPPPVTTYDIRDIVLGKVRGFPSWPGMVVDPETVPPGVQRERPGGKKAVVYCVRFFPKGDYAWLAPKDISKLQTHEIHSYLNEPHKKSGDLMEGYKIALDPKHWEETIAELTALGEPEPDEEVDQLHESEGESHADAAKKSKKRKRESDAAGSVKPKAQKKPRQSKKGSEEPVSGKGKRGGAGARGRKNGSKSKAMVESEDEGGAAGDAGEEEGGEPRKAAASPPPAKKGKRSEEDELEADLQKDPEAVRVREWRHRLQKTFLSSKVPPKEEDMPIVNTLFTTIETYEKMTVQYLQFSKIGKVMRHIAALDDEKVPLDGEFNFRDRAKALVDKWHLILNKATGGPVTSAPAINGTSAEDVPTHVTAAQVDAGEGSVAEQTAALDLNGKAEEPLDVPQDGTADAPGSVVEQPTAVAAEQEDVSMSEA